MKTLKLIVAVFAVFIVSGLTQINAQKSKTHWLNASWTGDIPIDCPNSDVTNLHGTISADFVVHLDDAGNWAKLNGYYHKSEFIANTGEVFTVFGALTQGFTNPNCFNETLQMFGNEGTKITGRTNIRYRDGELVREMVIYHCSE